MMATKEYLRQYYLNNCDKAKQYAKDKRLALRKLADNGLLKKPDLSSKCCKVCTEEKPINQFSFHTSSGAYQNACKSCRAIAAKKYRDENKEKVSRNARKNYVAKRKNCFNHKTKRSFRGRLAKLMERKKDNNSVEYLGCTYEMFQKWLKFSMEYIDENITEKNHGSYWHIDHVVPCNAFDFNDPEQAKLCFHWTNLLPKEKKGNISKSDNIELWDLCLRNMILGRFIESQKLDNEEQIALVTDKAMKIALSVWIKVPTYGKNTKDWVISSQAPKDEEDSEEDSDNVHGEGSETKQELA